MSALPLPSGSGVLNTDINPMLLGWIDFVWFGTTLAYVSADAPTFVFSINADVTGVVEPGMRVRLTQTTDKFFIVTAVGAYSGGVTQITVYGGTDYTLANASISAGAFSTHKKPFGFNANPAKWTETLVDSTSRATASPSSATWYNPGSLSLTIPIGAWRVRWEAVMFITTAGSGNPSISTALSTANNSASDIELRAEADIAANSAATFSQPAGRGKVVVVAAKTPYYMVVNNVGGLSGTAIGLKGDEGSTTVRAECAYL